MNAEEIFIRQSVAYARTLPIHDAVTYLRGMLACIGESDLVANVRSVYLEMSHCDSQLELIATGQMTLLPDHESRSDAPPPLSGDGDGNDGEGGGRTR